MQEETLLKRMKFKKRLPSVISDFILNLKWSGKKSFLHEWENAKKDYKVNILKNIMSKLVLHCHF